MCTYYIPVCFLLPVNAWQLEWGYILCDQIEIAVKCHEVGSCWEERRGFWLAAGYWRQRIIWYAMDNYVSMNLILWWLSSLITHVVFQLQPVLADLLEPFQKSEHFSNRFRPCSIEKNCFQVIWLKGLLNIDQPNQLRKRFFPIEHKNPNQPKTVDPNRTLPKCHVLCCVSETILIKSLIFILEQWKI